MSDKQQDLSLHERVVGYARLSRAYEDGLPGIGLESQRIKITDEIGRRGFHLVSMQSDIASGGSTDKRPGLAACIQLLEQRAAGTIMVAKIDRLSRSIVDFANLLATAKKKGWNVIALDLGVDLLTPHGQFLATVMASVAELERHMIGQRTKEALAVKKAQGIRLGRPFADPAARKRIKQLRADGRTYREICETLTAEGFQTPRKAKSWHIGSVARIATRPDD